MKKITIYSSLICSYCFSAKKILENENLDFKEIIVDGDKNIREEMFNRSNGKTSVPQIFFGNELIGGYDELKKLETLGLIKKKLHE